MLNNYIAGGGGSVLCVAWSRGSAYQLAGGDSSGQLRLYDVRRAGPLHTFRADVTPASPVPALAPAGMRPGAETAAAGAANAARTAETRPVATPTPGGQAMLDARPSHVQAHQGAVTGLLQTPDGAHWVSAGADNAMRLWDAQRWQNCLVRYPEAFNSARNARQLAIDDSGQVRCAPHWPAPVARGLLSPDL